MGAKFGSEGFPVIAGLLAKNALLLGRHGLFPPGQPHNLAPRCRWPDCRFRGRVRDFNLKSFKGGGEGRRKQNIVRHSSNALLCQLSTHVAWPGWQVACSVASAAPWGQFGPKGLFFEEFRNTDKGIWGAGLRPAKPSQPEVLKSPKASQAPTSPQLQPRLLARFSEFGAGAQPGPRPKTPNNFLSELGCALESFSIEAEKARSR